MFSSYACRVDIRMLIIEVAEKLGLIATAALVSVLVPPLRNRLLGMGGRPRDRLMAFLFGMCLAMWGSKMGVSWLGHHVHVSAIGVLIAAILGGSRAGVLTGLGSGLFYVFRVDDSLGLVGIVFSVTEGAIAGALVDRAPRLFQGWRALWVTLALQLAKFGAVGVALMAFSPEHAFFAAWPAHLVQALGNAFGVALFVVVARVVLAREEAAVALVQARAAADQLALEALRRRLEPHFLFNALNALRATIRTNPSRARDLVSHLADLYRYLLTHPHDAPLESEVDHALSYLAIEQARLGEGRLSYERRISADVAHLRVPALLLQPLVENAVKHGIAAHDGRGQVELSAKQDAGELRIEVRNQSEGSHLGPVTRGAGIAVTTLRQHLMQRFEGRASLELVPVERGMNVTVRLPCDMLLTHPVSLAPRVDAA